MSKFIKCYYVPCACFAVWWFIFVNTGPRSEQTRQDHDPIEVGSFVESDRIENSWADEKLVIRSLFHSDRIVLESGPGAMTLGRATVAHLGFGWPMILLPPSFIFRYPILGWVAWSRGHGLGTMTAGRGGGSGIACRATCPISFHYIS